MKRGLVILVMAAWGLAGQAGAGQGATTFYVQLVRGTETTLPPTPGSRQIGPKLAATFRPVFRWNSYWEMSRQQVALAPGKIARVRLGNGREAEIDLRQPQERRVTAFYKGQVVERTTSPTGEAMTVIGGNRDAKSAW